MFDKRLVLTSLRRRFTLYVWSVLVCSNVLVIKGTWSSQVWSSVLCFYRRLVLTSLRRHSIIIFHTLGLHMFEAVYLTNWPPRDSAPAAI